MDRVILTTDGRYIMALSEKDKIRYGSKILTEGRTGIDILLDSVIEKNKNTEWLDMTDFERYIVHNYNPLFAIHWQNMGTISNLIDENIMFRVFVLNCEIEEMILVEKRANHILVKSKNKERTCQYIRKHANHPFKYESVSGPDCVFSKRDDAKKYLIDYWARKENLCLENLESIRKMIDTAEKL